MRNLYAVIIILCSLLNQTTNAQTISFELKTSPNIVFDFNTIQEYMSGIVIMNAVTLNINTTERFDIYVGATTTAPGFWNVGSTYSTGGIPPPISILQLQFRNASSTSQVSGFFPLQDIAIASRTYIIGTSLSDVLVACPAGGTNSPGDYLTTPSCYKFNVDLKIVPGLTYQSGLYDLRVDYVIVEDL